MPRWLKVIRGMIGTGLTFAAGVGLVSSLVGLVAMLAGELSGRELLEIAGKLSAVASVVGVAFAGVLAISAHGRPFDRLSLRNVTALGAGGGLLYFLFIASMNGFRSWSPLNAIGNLVILTLLGSGSAAVTLLVARRAVAALNSGEESRSLGEGVTGRPLVRRATEQKPSP